MINFAHNFIAAKDSRRIQILWSPLAASAAYQIVQKSAYYYAAPPIASSQYLRYLST